MTRRRKRRVIYISSIALFIFFFLIPADTLSVSPETRGEWQGTSQNLDKRYIPGEVLVKFKKRVAQERITRAPGKLPATAVKDFLTNSMKLVKLKHNENVEDAVAEYTALPEVEYAQPNYLYYPCQTPDDGSFDNLWALNNTGQTVNFITGTADADIDAPEAWDLETGVSDVVIAVIDTGVDYRHPDLANNTWVNTGEIPGNGLDDDGNGYDDDEFGWDFFDMDNDPMDPDGHGTHVAGIIAAEGNNSKAVSGIGWNLNIMALKVGGSSGFFTTSRLVGAIDYAVQMGARVINASWGGSSFDQAVLDAISRAHDGGVLFVAAAGNGNPGKNIDLSPFYPASYDLQNIISVAATNQNDELAFFSNYGQNSVDVGAPGTNILSTYVKRIEIWNDDFEDDDISDWTHGGVNDSWGSTDEHGNVSTYSLTDSPFSNYENNTDSFVKRNIDLSNMAGAVLSGMVRGSSEETFDRLFVQESRDGAFWDDRKIEVFINSESVLEEFLSGNMDDVWRKFKVDLGFIDNVSGHFRFFFETNGTTVDDGWYLDDLKIEITGASTANDIRYLQGTSMAAPFVSGLAGLILSSNPSLTPGELKTLILSGVDTKESLTEKVLSGGRINAHTSLTTPLPENTGGSGGGCTITGASTTLFSTAAGWVVPYLMLFLYVILRKRKKKPGGISH